MASIRRFIETSPGLVMISGGLVGFLLPLGPYFPSVVLLFLLGGLVFLSCFKLQDFSLSAFSYPAFLFWALRFVFLPVCLFFLAQFLTPSFALGVLLMALSPAAMASATIALIYGGSASLSFAIMVLSNLACIAVIPLMMGWIGHTVVAIPVSLIAQSLVFCMLIPIVLYLGLRRFSSLQAFGHHNGRLISILILGLLFLVALTNRRDYLLGHFQEMMVPLAWSLCFYGASFVVGLVLIRYLPRGMTYALCSLFNNSSLGISLALLYFDEQTSALLIAASIVWIFLPVPAFFLKKALEREQRTFS